MFHIVRALLVQRDEGRRWWFGLSAVVGSVLTVLLPATTTVDAGRPKGDWGAPTAQVEAAFDRVWLKPICRGQQAIQPGDYDWPSLFEKLYANRATYCEIYAPSFTRQHKAELAREIQRFAGHIRARGPLMPKERSEP